MAFPFENMVVYQKAERWAEIAEKFASRKGSGANLGILDQLSRAANSIPLNIAEGLGKWAVRDRRRFLHIARGSVYECVPLINILKRKGITTSEEHALSYGLLDELGKMLTTLIKADNRFYRK